MRRKCRILLVEDDPLQASITKKALEFCGHLVEHVSSGEAAVLACRNNPPPEIILMDIDLGTGINGLEAARQIKARARLPVIIHSSHGEAWAKDQAKQHGCEGYVIKTEGYCAIEAAIQDFFQGDALAAE